MKNIKVESAGNNDGKLPGISKKKQRKLKSTGEKKLKPELELLRNENSEMKDQRLRKLAEFDNYKKRIKREYGEMISQANSSIIQNLLPVVDDLERSLDQEIDDNGKEEFRKGIELIYLKLTKILDDAGLTAIESNGKEFDPEIHDAMMQIENNDVPSNHVIDTLEKGYCLNERIIRHAKVSVSK